MVAPRGVTKLSEFLPKDKNNLDLLLMCLLEKDVFFMIYISINMGGV